MASYQRLLIFNLTKLARSKEKSIKKQQVRTKKGAMQNTPRSGRDGKKAILCHEKHGKCVLNFASTAYPTCLLLSDGIATSS